VPHLGAGPVHYHQMFGEEERGNPRHGRFTQHSNNSGSKCSFPLFFPLYCCTMQFSDSLVYNNSDPNGPTRGAVGSGWAQQQAMVNPAVPQRLRGSVQAVKNREGAEGMRSHSCVMKKEYMT